MIRRAPFVTLCLTLAACGGSDGGTNPPPPPVNRVASLAAVDSSILQFTGHKVALSKLFVAKDAAGVVIPNAYLSCVTPAGFTLTGDSLVAPSAETRGKLRCSATTIAPSSMMLAPALASTPNPADSLTVTAGIDLRAYTWRAAWKCTGGGRFVSWEPHGVVIGQVDSAAFDGRATFIYPDAATFVQNWGGVAQVSMWSGTETLYRGGAVVYSDTNTFQTSETIDHQTADELAFFTGSLYRTSLTPRRYEGGTWCKSISSLLDPIGPVTLEDVTP